MKDIAEMKYFEARRLLNIAVGTKIPAFSFSAATRKDLERILGPKTELISRLEHCVAPGGYVPGPMAASMRKRRALQTVQWHRVAGALAQLRRSLASLDYDAGRDLETGYDGMWEFEHNREGPDIDLVDFAAYAARIEAVLEWLLKRLKKPKLRGRPRGISHDRRFLGLAVAHSLRQAGFRLTKGRDGILAQTLTVLFDVAELGVPEDMFDSVRSIVKQMEANDRRRQEMAEKGLGDPATLKPPVE